MRILHTADWHLGKIVSDYSMLGHQEEILKQLIDIAISEKVDAVVMSGDIYDRSLPSKETVTLFNKVLSAFHDHKLVLIAIAGNHDSPERIEYGAQFLAFANIHLVANKLFQVVSLGDTDFYCFPFSDPYKIRHELNDPNIKSLQDVVEATLSKIELNNKRQHVLLYHGFVVGEAGVQTIESDSERPLSIGTASMVEASLLKDFDYVALGHLHAPQKVVSNKIQYSGSILKYSKSEVNHKKVVKIVDIENHEVMVREVLLKPVRDMVVIKGDFDSLMTQSSDDYCFIELTDENLVIDAMSRLKKHYPYAMGLEYINLFRQKQDVQVLRQSDIDTKSEVELFEDFYEQYRDKKFDHKQREVVLDLLEKSGDES